MTKEQNKKCDVEGLLNETQASCVTAHVAGLRAVEFYFHFAAHPDSPTLPRRLPYAINWNGVMQPEGRIAMLPETNVIRVLARSGQEVSLYLGSDASPEFRQVPLYTVKVGNNDVRVDIYDKRGKHDDTAVLTEPVQKDVPTGHGDKVDKYKAALTGDIWMQFSHKYTVAEALKYAADAGLAGDTEIVAVLNAVYSGQVGKSAYRTPLGGQDCRIVFQEGADATAAANIKKGYSFASECQTRVHPNTWIATLQAARNAKVTGLEMSSGWRPYLGSKVHRLGLGFDVKYLQQQGGKVQTFDAKSPQLYASAEEKSAHQELLAASQTKLDANKAFESAQIAEKRATGEEGKRLASQRTKEAEDAAKDAADVEDRKRRAFDKIHQTTPMWSFERELLLSPLVKQVMDPFYVDLNTADNKPGSISVEPNRQIDGNEKLHKNHLHITARDSYLQP